MPKVAISIKIKQSVADRANRICEYCRSPEQFSSSKFSVEHIVPVHLSGTNELDNLAFACQGCNNIKFIKTTGIDPETKAIVSLFHPRQHIWTTHFAWDDSILKVLGLTPIGRATIDAINLNRTEVCNLRSLLFLIGEHPPKP